MLIAPKTDPRSTPCFPPTTTSPARQAPEERTPLRHIIHHEEADGTIHYLCGIQRAPGAAVKDTHADKVNCAACEAAAYLLEVMP